MVFVIVEIYTIIEGGIDYKWFRKTIATTACETKMWTDLLTGYGYDSNDYKNINLILNVDKFRH